MKLILKKIKKMAFTEFWIGIILLLAALIAILFCCFQPIKCRFLSDDLLRIPGHQMITSEHDETFYRLETYYFVECYGENSDGYFMILPVGNGSDEVSAYMGCFIDAKDYDKTNSMIEAFIDGAPDKSMKMSGILLNMDTKEKQFFDETCDEIDPDGNYGFKKNAIYKTFYPLKITDFIDFGKVLIIIISLFFCGLGVFMMLPIITKSYKKEFFKQVAGLGITEDEFVRDMAVSSDFREIMIGENYTILLASSPIIFKNKDLVWSYVRTETTHYKAYGIIPTGSSTAYKVVVLSRNSNKENMINVKNQDEGNVVVESLSKAAPWMVAGYSEEIKNVYMNNYNGFLAHCNEIYNREKGISVPETTSGSNLGMNNMEDDFPEMIGPDNDSSVSANTEPTTKKEEFDPSGFRFNDEPKKEDDDASSKLSPLDDGWKPWNS